MENKNELQDMNLDDILSELHDIVGDDVPEVEPDEELQELLGMPELTITPVVVKETDIDQLLPDRFLGSGNGLDIVLEALQHETERSTDCAIVIDY